MTEAGRLPLKRRENYLYQFPQNPKKLYLHKL